MQPFDSLSYRGQLQRLRRLAHSALAHYAVPEPRLIPLRHETNTTFRVLAADGQQYVLRIHNPEGHTVAQIRSELQWLMALRQDTDLGVPEPVLTRDGSSLTTVDIPGIPEPRTCVLFRWLDGRFFNDHLTPQHLERMGILMAQLHAHTAQWQRPADFTRGRVDVLMTAARREGWSAVTPVLSTPAVYPADEDVAHTLDLIASHCLTQDAAIVAHVLTQIRAVFHELGEGQAVFGLIHADLHQENYLFRHSVPQVIDFDDCGWGHYLFDFTVTLYELAQIPTYPSLRAALLRGYRTIRPFPEQHEAYLDTFLALRRIQLLIWVIESRDHPAFRAGWVEWARNDLQELGQFLARV